MNKKVHSFPLKAAYKSKRTYNVSSTKTAAFLPLLTDSKTEAYVRFAKVILIFKFGKFRDKSAIIKQLAEKYRHACCVCSDEKYLSLPDNESKDALSLCYKDVLHGCREGKNLVIIDIESLDGDSFLKDIVSVASQAKYQVLLEPPFYSCETVNDSKSSSQLPVLPYSRMHHLYFGWILNQTDSSALQEEACLYLNDCKKLIKTFVSMFQKFLHDDDDIDLETYFNMNTNCMKGASCIAKVCNQNDVAELQSYFEACHYAYGKKTTLHIIGFVVSPYIVAARVKLNYKQKELWSMNDTSDSELKNSLEYILKHEEPITTEISSISCKCKCTLTAVCDKQYDSVACIKGKGRTAHFILGSSMLAKSDNIFCDVLDAIKREEHAVMHDEVIDSYDFEKFFVKRLGKFWVIYLKSALAVDALFASKCFITK